MLTEEQVKSLLVVRVMACLGSCNSHHINHCEGQIRALLAVLTGKRPPRVTDAVQTLTLAGIPCRDDGEGGFVLDDDWLEAHGFTFTRGEDDDVSHPDFPKW